MAFLVEDTRIIIMPDWDLQHLIHIMILTRRSAQHTAGVQAAQVFLFIVNSIMIVRHLTQVQYNLYGPSSPPPCYHQTILAKYFLPVCRDRSASRLQAPGSALQHSAARAGQFLKVSPCVLKVKASLVDPPSTTWEVESHWKFESCLTDLTSSGRRSSFVALPLAKGWDKIKSSYLKCTLSSIPRRYNITELELEELPLYSTHKIKVYVPIWTKVKINLIFK